MNIKILTLFPEMFKGFLESSILSRGIEEGLVHIELVNIRDFSLNKHKKVDDYVFGGGPGMVIQVEPLDLAIEACKEAGTKQKLIYFSPRGQVLNQALGKTLADGFLKRKEMGEPDTYDELVLICGHYEGIDERIFQLHPIQEISVGDYILTGGEIPAMVLIDTLIRFLPSVLGNEDSASEDSFSNGLLEHPQYTRPREYKGLQVPEVLLSGNHKEIEKWRKNQSLKITKERRPDML